MCNICGIVSEKFRPTSAYWGKMCEYATQSSVMESNGCYMSGTGDCYCKEIAGNRYLAVIDGKINNCDALKRSLGLRGTIVETENIAELVILCYVILGDGCFKLFKGSFCAIIWDGMEQELIMFRDKVGINTLFYYYDGIRLIYSSEIKSIFNFPCAKKDLSDDIYCRLFALAGGRFMGETLFKKIFEIPAGCYIKYKSSNLKVENYHMFSITDIKDTFKQTVNGLEYLCKDVNVDSVVQEKVMTKDGLKENIEKFIEINDLPSPYIDLKIMTNMDSKEDFFDLTCVFNIPERFRLPSVWCRHVDKEFTDSFLSTIPWFEYKDEKDITDKENIYIKQYIVLPQMVNVRKKACKNINFPYLNEEVVEYSLKSMKYSKKISKYFGLEQQKCNKTNYKNLKSLFYEMLSDKNLMAGFVEREELMKFIRLFPRPETMLYLLQVNVWLNKYV